MTSELNRTRIIAGFYYDGNYYYALVDASGHVQVDVLTSPLEALIGEVQASPTANTVLARLKTLETLLAGGLPAALDGLSLKVKEQSPLTEIDVDIAKVLGSAISLTNYVPIGIAYPAGTLIDPRSIRALTNSDVVTVEQATATSLKAEIHQPSTKEDFQIVTSGADNIVIDKLTQTAYTERRTTISNNGTTATYVSVAGDIRAGKFFPRGCRGFIDTVDLYCYDGGASGGTFTVWISPFPGAPALYTSTVTIPAGGGVTWRSANFDIFWPFDSLFIYILGSSTDMVVGRDAGTPYDRYVSTDVGVTWYADNYRLWFRAIMKGESIGEVTIGGIVTAKRTPVKQSGVLAADTAVKAAPGLVYWITCEAGASASVFQLNDSTDNSGTDKWQGKVPANDTRHIIFDPPLPMYAGVYLDVDANIGSCTVGYI